MWCKCGEVRGISFHKSCKYECLLNKTVCNDEKKWNKDQCRCECLKIKKCDINFFWYIVNYRCEHKKAAKLMVEKECEKIVDDDILNNKTVSVKEHIENCNHLLLHLSCLCQFQ